MNPTRRHVLQSTLGLAAVSLAPVTFAQGTFPSAPLRFIISTPAGGGHDIMSRTIGAKLTEAWGQPAVVESKPGASGTIAISTVARGLADGHNMLVIHSGLLTNLVLQPNPGYKLSDLVPVCMLVLTPIALGVRATLGVNTVQEYVALAKRQPGKLSYGSYGQGSGGHFIGEQLNVAANIDVLHVPYKGEAPALQDVVGGQVDGCIVSIGGVSRFPGVIKPLAVASETRFARYPDVPTFAESGLPAVNMPGWGGVFVPASTPKAVVNKLTAELNRVIMLPDVAAKMQELGFESVAWGPEKTTAFLEQQMTAIRKLVDTGRVKL